MLLIFQAAQVTLYGKEETVHLLWGQGQYQELRFVLVRMGDRLSILVSTDLTLETKDIIRLYGHRFQIECTFPRNETSHRRIRLSVLEQIDAKTKALAKKGGISST